MKLRRTLQCEKCPWRQETDPHDIPDGYCAEKHAALACTIAREGDLAALADRELHVMACHESHDDYCLGWLMNQLGPGNNIALRIQMLQCANLRDVRLRGAQHECFDDTLPYPEDQP